MHGSLTEREPQLLRQGSGFVLYALMDAVVDRYFPIMDRLESELEEIEEQIFAKSSARTNIEQLYDLKHKITRLDVYKRHSLTSTLTVSGNAL